MTENLYNDGYAAGREDALLEARATQNQLEDYNRKLENVMVALALWSADFKRKVDAGIALEREANHNKAADTLCGAAVAIGDMQKMLVRLMKEAGLDKS